MRKGGHVYIVGSSSRALYVGVTADLRAAPARASLRRGRGLYDAVQYLWRLLWCEPHDDILGAIAREKQIKRRRREKKVALIAQSNSEFRDLWPLLNR